MQVACRQCAACLKARAHLWGNKAKAEYAQAPRTWFGTLTIAPNERYRAVAAARVRLERGGVDFDALPPVERFAELHRELGPLVTKYFKRLRKERKKREGAKKPREGLLFRYLLTVEPHEDWMPHYHLLVHEVTSDRPVLKSNLEEEWPHGVVHWRLVKDHHDKKGNFVSGEAAAFYAAKYLGKYSVARVRASERYGVAVPTPSGIAPSARANIDPPKTHASALGAAEGGASEASRAGDQAGGLKETDHG